uniref:Bardet-Biedl syndrome 10 n=1 Tax=Varanus komodoensis TaxID=61221 RepID=A0A8D2J0P9_VARKO
SPVEKRGKGSKKAAAALAGVVRGSLGPEGGQVLLTRPTGEVVLSRDGRRVLEALNVSSPTARTMIACISTHCSFTGDGAKTFIILLSNLLQELEKLCRGDGAFFCENIRGREKYKEKCYRLKQVSQLLMMIQTDILDPIMIQDLQRHFLSVFSVFDAEINRSAMCSVLEAYFCGKVGNNRQTFLSQLTYDFYLKVTADKNRNEVLSLLDECFAELHATVTGLPVSSSRILDGLILQRDFTVYCPADGNIKVLIITEPIHASVSNLGVEVAIMSERQHEASEIWNTKRTEALIQHMQNNNIKVLLSSVKQQEIVHYYAKNSGISIVECLSPEEISLICRITKISPFRPSVGNIYREITETAVAVFCQPLQLGTRRFVHIGFAKTCALQLHSVIFCGPVVAVVEQHACAFHGAFKMLKQMFITIHLTEHCKSKTGNQSLSKAVNSGSVVQQCCVEEHTNCNDVQAGTKPLSPFPIKTQKLPVPSTLESSLTQSQKCNYQTEMLNGSENELLEDNQLISTTVEKSTSSRNVPVQLPAYKNSSSIPICETLFNYEENNKSNVQRNSNSYIRAGSVVPVGGIFEILLHYYLSYYAKQCQYPNMSILCTLIADVLLNVPKLLCRTQKRNAFPQLCFKVTSTLKNDQQLWLNQRLESVSCKYQLVVSVLHCAARLLSVDMIIGIKRLPQKAEESDSDIDL